MANGKRSTYRRKGRRGNRSLTTRRIFNNKSAKAQAAQIYALRKSVSRVRRQCRPEIKEVSRDFEARQLGRVTSIIPAMEQAFAVRTPVPDTMGTADNQRIGNIAKLLPLKFRFSATYREIYGTAEGSTYWNIPQLPTHGMQIRIFAIQARSPTTAVPPIIDILESYSGDSGDYNWTMSNLTRPFKNGITARYHVLFNKVYSISQDKPLITRSLSIRPKVRTIRWEDGSTYPRGQIFVYVLQGGAVNRVLTAEPNNLLDYNSISFMYKMVQPFTDA